MVRHLISQGVVAFELLHIVGNVISLPALLRDGFHLLATTGFLEVFQAPEVVLVTFIIQHLPVHVAAFAESEVLRAQVVLTQNSGVSAASRLNQGWFTKELDCIRVSIHLVVL